MQAMTIATRRCSYTHKERGRGREGETVVLVRQEPDRIWVQLCNRFGACRSFTRSLLPDHQLLELLPPSTAFRLSDSRFLYILNSSTVSLPQSLPSLPVYLFLIAIPRQHVNQFVIWVRYTLFYLHFVWLAQMNELKCLK